MAIRRNDVRIFDPGEDCRDPDYITIDSDNLYQTELKLEAKDSHKPMNIPTHFQIAAFWLATGLFAIGIIVGSAYFEASSYNRITGSNVSTWDALWLDLRVNGEPNGGK